MKTYILIVIASLVGSVQGSSVHHINFHGYKTCQKASEILKTDSNIKSYCVEK